MSRLVKILFSVAWLLGVPLLAAYVGYPSAVWKGWFIDTSRATAAKIRPGMTIAEVEQIIGGPAGKYVFPEASQGQLMSGNRWPNTIEWVTYDGKIVVRDGEWGFGVAHPDTKTIDTWSTAKGVVEHVYWEPYDPSKANPGGFWVLVGVSFIFALIVWLMSTDLWWSKTQPQQPNPHLETT
jgi:hypothetical protein